MGRLKGKTAMVVGAGSVGPGWGNGKATAVTFAREGAQVFCVDRNVAAAEETVNIIKSEGNKASAFTADVSRASDVEAMVAACLKTYGRIDVLDNNVGIAEMGSVVEVTEAEWDRVFAVNLKSAFLAMKHVIPVMQKQGGGSIINISSIFGLVGSPGFAAYHASKGGVRLLTKSTAMAHAPEQIRCNSIHPGVIETPMLQAVIDRSEDPVAARAEWMKSEPIGRFGRPEDIAYGALYLASDEAAFVTGSELVIDGGYTAV